MKIIAVNRCNVEDCVSSSTISVYPDSAIITNSRPFFIPDFLENPVGYAAVAFRVGRLGKSIPRKFASRYIDAVTVALLTGNRDECGTPQAAVSLPGTVFDGSILIGKWLTVNENHAITFPEAGITIDSGKLIEAAEDTIAELSQYMTLKMGDIIIPCHDSQQLELHANVDFEFHSGDDILLTVKPR